MIYTEDLYKTYLFGGQEAERLGCTEVEPEHFLLGLLRLGKGKGHELLSVAKLNLLDLKSKLEVNRHDIVEPMLEQALLSTTAKRIQKLSELEARGFQAEYCDTEHLILAILKEQKNLAATTLHSMEFDYEKAAALLHQPTDLPTMGASLPDEDEDDEIDFRGNASTQSGTTTQTTANTKSNTPALDNFGTDITKAAQANKLDPIVGREQEIERIVQILSRRKKNNPILIGDPGVGKSAIVEGLALRIVQKRVSRVLMNKRIVALDMATVVAGTKYRGQFEERMKAILNEVANHPEIILFIDEIHTIVGAGSTPGSLDAANMLKPALARGEIQCIGATTLDEYRSNIEKDGALERRFQKVLVEPTTKEETRQILRNIADRYEYHHNVRYTDEALDACVNLAERYITDRCFPDKAIDVLDEAGARIHIQHLGVPPEIEATEKEIETIREQKNAVIAEQKFELAVALRDQEVCMQKALDQQIVAWENQYKANPETVAEEHIADVVSLISGIPVQRVAQAEGVRLREIKQNLQAKIIGQDTALQTIAKSIQRNRIGLKDPNKPIGSFIFLGPTGVGKTHLAKCLAEFMFGSKDAIIRIDMSEYMEKFSVSRLIGAPPGYVGYEEGGQLTERVRRKPYSIVLLDEIEKAHPDVFNILLQVMDEGQLTDSLGRRVNFKNTIIIMTSNVGTRQLKDFGRGVGFNLNTETSLDSEYARGVIQKALHKTFSPEFLNRVDEIVTFDQLSKETIHTIIDLELEGLYKRVQEMGYALELTQGAKTYIADHGYNAQYGARPLKRAIQKYVEDELAELLLTQELKQGDKISIDLVDEKIVVKVN